jgi:hypothetical protein
VYTITIAHAQSQRVAAGAEVGTHGEEEGYRLWLQECMPVRASTL